MGPAPSARKPDRRRRAFFGFGAAVALALAAQIPQAVTSAQTAPADVGAAATRGTTADLRVLSSSFHGGLEWDEGSDVEVDRAGNLYLTGFTLSPDLPVPGAAQAGLAGLADGFVTKVAADGRRLLWSTYLGGVDIDVPTSLAMDRHGNVYVTGRTGSPDFPTTEGAFQPGLRGRACQGEPCHDAFVTKIDPSGRVVFSTLFGGSANEEGVSIAVDRAGRAWITGNTDSTDLPVRRAVQPEFQSPPCPADLPCEYDVFVAALAADGSRLTFASYLGGDASDTAGGIAVDRAGSAYVTGTTRSANFPTTDAALQPSINGLDCGPPPGAPCLDAFAVKITHGRLAYSTYLGGSGDERPGGVAVDRAGQAVITGSTRSPDLPVRSAVQAEPDNASCSSELPEERCDDAFVSQLSANGGSLVFSTYLGGQAEDQGLAVTVDRSGDVYVAGRTDSRDFPVRRAGQPDFGGYIDGFATKLAHRTGALVWSTFVGGDEADRVTGVDTHRDGGVHLTGRTLSPDFPTVDAFQPALAQDDDYDAFLHVLE